MTLSVDKWHWCRFAFNSPALHCQHLPPTLRIHYLLYVLFVVKCHSFTSIFKEIILCVPNKDDSDMLGRDGGGSLVAERVGVVTAHNLIR